MKNKSTVSDPRYESEKGLVSVFRNEHKSPQESCRRRKIQLMCGVAYLNKTFLMGAETKWMLIITMVDLMHLNKLKKERIKLTT
jgi:hypothetical protein